MSNSTLKDVIKVINFKGSAVHLLKVMLEKTDHATELLAENMSKFLDFEALYETAVDFDNLRCKHSQDKHAPSDCICKYGKNSAEQNLLKTYHVAQVLKDYGYLKEEPGEHAFVVEQVHNSTFTIV